MTTHQFVTTFSVPGYHSYGMRFIDSFLEHGDGRRLTIYHESQINKDEHELLEWRNLDADADRARFIADWGNDPSKVGTPADPNSQAIRFCHKVFAITDAIERADTDWVIWVDADVVFTKRIAHHHLERVMPQGALLAFLGRIDYGYTECGFVAYKASSQVVKNLAADMRSYYTSGEIFTRHKSDWHDSRCFDICRKRSQIPNQLQHNISAGVRGIHVWPLTPLNDWCVHHKGPRRKQEAYGSVVR